MCVLDARQFSLVFPLFSECLDFGKRLHECIWWFSQFFFTFKLYFFSYYNNNVHTLFSIVFKLRALFGLFSLCVYGTARNLISFNCFLSVSPFVISFGVVVSSVAVCAIKHGKCLLMCETVVEYCVLVE